jgi:lipoate-protein ligase A
VSGPRALAPELTLEAGAEEFARGDESLLRRGGPGARVALLRERCVSFGVAVNPLSAYLRRAALEGIPCVARQTGGAGLLHEPGDLSWSVVRRRDDPLVGKDFARAYDRLGHGVRRWLETLGLEAEWSPAPGLAPEYCTLSDRGSVLTSAGRIVGGAAQHAVRGALLHQGSVSVGPVDRAAIDRYFALIAPSPSERLAGVRELGVDAPGPELARGLAQAIVLDLPASKDPEG